MENSTLSIISIWIASISCCASVLMFITTYMTLKTNEKAIDLNKSIFRRQGVFDLHLFWQSVNNINPEKPIEVDVRKAANALDLTAAFWNHDIMEKSILYQMYWPAFRDIYNSIQNIKGGVTSGGLKVQDILTPSIKLVYNKMQENELKRTEQDQTQL